MTQNTPHPAVPKSLHNLLKEYLGEGYELEARYVGLLTGLKRELHSAKEQAVGEVKVTGETSDGYHTFNQLYEFRKLYNAALFNEWWSQGKYSVTKSKRHDDGELCFGGGWFIVTAQLPSGQISNHYELKDWELFKCDEFVNSPKWDGHTAEDVAKRLRDLLTPPERTA